MQLDQATTIRQLLNNIHDYLKLQNSYLFSQGVFIESVGEWCADVFVLF